MGTAQPTLLKHHVVAAPSPNNPNDTVRLCLRSDTLQQYAGRWISTTVAEYYAIVRGGILHAKHAFRGVKRPMAEGSQMDVDQRVIVYSWRPLFSAAWVGGDQFSKHTEISYRAVPPGVVLSLFWRERTRREMVSMGQSNGGTGLMKIQNCRKRPLAGQPATERDCGVEPKMDEKKAEITAFVKEALGQQPGVFRPCAFFDDRLDCIRVIAKDCSILEERISDRVTILLDLYAPRERKECVGFTLKGANHLCQQHGWDPARPVRMSMFLDAILASVPEKAVKVFIEFVAKPLVADKKIEEVERARLSSAELVPA